MKYYLNNLLIDKLYISISMKLIKVKIVMNTWSNYAFMIIPSHASKKGTSRDGEFPT